MKTISPTELSQETSSRTLIDVRTPQEYQEAHIQNAVLHSLDDLDSTRLESQIGGKRPIIVSCFSGKRAMHAAQKLEVTGWDVTLLEGSLQGWEKAGLPVVRGTPQGIPIMRQVIMIAGGLNLLIAFLAMKVSPLWIWLNVVSGLALLFSGLSGICWLASLLRKMPWNRLPCTSCKQ